MMKKENNPTITTMSIDIQVIRVGDKQMTLSVFKQIPVKKESKNSCMWGFVNYMIKEKKHSNWELWIIFSENGELFRRGINSIDFYSNSIEEIQKDINDKSDSILNIGNKISKLENDKIDNLDTSKWFMMDIDRQINDAKKRIEYATCNKKRYEKEVIHYQEELSLIKSLKQLYIAI